MAALPIGKRWPSGGQSIGASTSTLVLPVNIQGWFPLGLIVWSFCSWRDSQESSPAVHLESINFSPLSLLYSPSFTSLPTFTSYLLSFTSYWKNCILGFWLYFLSYKLLTGLELSDLALYIDQINLVVLNWGQSCPREDIWQRLKTFVCCSWVGSTPGI